MNMAGACPGNPGLPLIRGRGTSGEVDQTPPPIHITALRRAFLLPLRPRIVFAVKLLATLFTSGGRKTHQEKEEIHQI